MCVLTCTSQDTTFHRYTPLILYLMPPALNSLKAAEIERGGEEGKGIQARSCGYQVHTCAVQSQLLAGISQPDAQPCHLTNSSTASLPINLIPITNSTYQVRAVADPGRHSPAW